jgi:catechol 2,3-dioxygenase-like lactoylglutathione lyase family enzyme
MTTPVIIGGMHHISLTVTDLERSERFYKRVLGFEQVADLGAKLALHNGSFLLVVNLAPQPEQALPNDRFDENRVGLDHISFRVESLAALEEAASALDELGVTRGAIRDLGQGFGFYVMAFRDPDNIQLELTALYD